MKRYLQHINAEHYGGLANRRIGPFSPELNIVYGPNEAGKSTLASLVGGVLFGWENAHGVLNTYRPPEGERAGSLEFAAYNPDESDGNDPAVILSRDETGAQGDFSLIGELDRETYDTIFSLTADELRSLRGSSDVVARLVAAASGTEASPSDAFVEIEQRIAAHTARANGGAHATATGEEAALDTSGDNPLPPDDKSCSIFQLEQQLEAKRAQMKQAAGRTELLLQRDREFHELEANRATTSERIEALSEELDDLASWKVEFVQACDQAEHIKANLSILRDELAERARASVPDGLDERLMTLGSADERVLRDRLEELAERQGKLERIADVAKENSATSAAAYEALAELGEGGAAPTGSSAWANRTLKGAVGILLPLAFIMAGVPLFVRGRQISSLSFTALGAGLVVFAALIAVAVVAFVFRPSKNEGVAEQRRQDAQWVMLQDRKKLDASTAERDEFAREIGAYLESVGLGLAQGSIRQARTLLDEAARCRAESAENDQRIASLDLRIRSGESELAELIAAQKRVLEAAGLPEGSSERDFDAAIRALSSQRDALHEAAESMSQRYGELKTELELARNDRTFDQLKLECYEVRARLRDSKHELMTLLLAKRLLERSIALWGNRNKPEVYSQASRLLSLMTNGRWIGVSASATGSHVAIASDGVERDPRHLSLGTCEQLYLALRLSLLIAVGELGENIPILADDILVHFDGERRRGAARALAELASRRQVIVFTCHKETVAALQAATACQLIEL